MSTFPRYLTDPPAQPGLAASDADRRAHVKAKLLRHTSVGSRYLCLLLNATPAGATKAYTVAEVERRLNELRNADEARYTPGRGWRLA